MENLEKSAEISHLLTTGIHLFRAALDEMYPRILERRWPPEFQSKVTGMLMAAFNKLRAAATHLHAQELNSEVASMLRTLDDAVEEVRRLLDLVQGGETLEICPTPVNSLPS